MLPVPRNGREFYLSGVRNSPAEEFGYLYLPLDEDGGLDGFNHFLSALRDKNKVNNTAHTMMLETLTDIKNRDEILEQNLQQTLSMLVTMFMRGGFAEVTDFIETSLPDAEKQTLGPAYLSMLREMLARVYFSDINQGATSKEQREAQLLFLQDSVDAIGSFSRYGAPVYLELTDYNHVQASGLQIARSPGKPVVYFGCALLIIGVFVLFYLPQRRLWIRVKQADSEAEVLLAGMSNRNPREFDQYFDQIAQLLKASIGNSTRS
jgi:cytochrome c biogenesis protein